MEESDGGLAGLRKQMVENQLVYRGIRDVRVLERRERNPEWR